VSTILTCVVGAGEADVVPLQPPLLRDASASPSVVGAGEADVVPLQPPLLRDSSPASAASAATASAASPASPASSSSASANSSSPAPASASTHSILLRVSPCLRRVVSRTGDTRAWMAAEHASACGSIADGQVGEAGQVHEIAADLRGRAAYCMLCGIGHTSTRWSLWVGWWWHPHRALSRALHARERTRASATGSPPPTLPGPRRGLAARAAGRLKDARAVWSALATRRLAFRLGPAIC
jgi:hypothetical protein